MPGSKPDALPLGDAPSLPTRREETYPNDLIILVLFLLRRIGLKTDKLSMGDYSQCIIFVTRKK